MIEVVTWKNEDRNIEEFHQRKADRNNHILFRELFQEKNFSYMEPYSIEIETINRCNNDCSFCAVNIHHDTRVYQKMSEELFYKIIEELSLINYKGYLSLFSNNEPLLDPRIYDFLEFARKKLPFARMSLFTNGILLNSQRFERLIGSLDYLTIDNYDDSKNLLPSVAAAIRPFCNQTFSCDVKVMIRKKNQVLSSRGGESPNRKMDLSYEGTCMMPFMQIVIRPDGKVSKCCQDGLGLSCIGDLTKETLRECWSNAKRREIWTALSNQGRKGIESCRFCDVFGHDNYLPGAWKPVIVQTFLKIVADQVLRRRKIILSGKKPGRNKIHRLLEENGIFVEQVLDRMEGYEIEEETFYILGDYEEPFLEKLDPQSKLAGERWIVYEKIPEYIYHDRTPQVLEFSKILSQFLENWGKTFCYWGDDEKIDLLEQYIQLPVYSRLFTEEDVRESVAEGGEDVCFLLAGEILRQQDFLSKELGIDQARMIRFDTIMKYVDLL